MPQTRTQPRESHDRDDTSLRQLLDDVPGPLAYRQLDLKSNQIRMLHLLPGSQKDPIRCVLGTVFLDDSPKYEALSYAWGDPLDCRSIEVDGRTKSVTVNLYHALRRLRYPQCERCLWVDALCINQDNDVEKSHQVNLMRKIYSRTERAILWLGDFSDGPTMATNQIPRQTATAAFSLLKSMAVNNHYCSGHEEGNKELADKGISSLSCLLQLPWWHRAWTVQEAVLPPNATIVCGTEQLPFSDLRQASSNSLDHYFQGCCDRRDDLYSFWDRLQGLDIAKRSITKTSTYSIHHACNLFRSRKASDPRDKLYAYFGLGTDMPANYSLSHEEVFKLTTRSLIEQSGTLQSLLRTAEDSRSPTLPTWVPDWCADFNEREFNRDMAWFQLASSYSAASGIKVTTRVSSSDDVLDLKGVILDRISAVGCILETPQSIKQTISEWQDKPTTEYPQGGTYREASWRTLAGDIYRGHGTYRSFTSSDDAEEIETNWIKQNPRWISVEAFKRRGITTDTGLIGIGNREIRVGDFISVLGGGSMPFILRQVEGHEDGVAYQYFGQA